MTRWKISNLVRGMVFLCLIFKMDGVMYGNRRKIKRGENREEFIIGKYTRNNEDPKAVFNGH